MQVQLAPPARHHTDDLTRRVQLVVLDFAMRTGDVVVVVVVVGAGGAGESLAWDETSGLACLCYPAKESKKTAERGGGGDGEVAVASTLAGQVGENNNNNDHNNINNSNSNGNVHNN
jgi:hypothetical protein